MSRWGGDCEHMRSSGSHHHLIPNELIYHRSQNLNLQFTQQEWDIEWYRRMFYSIIEFSVENIVELETSLLAISNTVKALTTSKELLRLIKKTAHLLAGQGERA
ncbi:hypothetical protein YC2023_006164 [Brassica napus]